MSNGKSLITHSAKYEGYLIERDVFEENYNAVLDHFRKEYGSINIDTETLEGTYIITSKEKSNV